MNKKAAITLNLVLISILLMFNSCNKAPINILDEVRKIPGITIEEIKSDSLFASTYKILLEQPLDHNNPNGKKFKQKMFLSHFDVSNPVVIIVDGYEVRKNSTYELSRYLKANQLYVEHRFFGESKPDSLDWKYLTIKQAAADHHRITELFKSIYKGKWASTGISKGGQTTIFYRRFYPNDVDVSVPYVAPINLAKEDPRLYNYLDNVAGTKECRENIVRFQRLVLERRNEILPMLRKHADEEKLSFTYNNFETAFEYMVLEYRFSFWQWGADCGLIPTNEASAQEIFDHLIKISTLSLFADKDMEYYAPFQYQANTEIGYYGFKIAPYKDLLKSIKEDVGSEMSFPYRDVELNFNPESMKEVSQWIEKDGNNMIYIYGENDAWSATSPDVSPETNSLKIVKKGGDHKTRINNLPDDQRELVLSTLEKWLDVKIKK